MKRPLLVAAVLIVIGAAGAALWYLRHDDREEQERYERGETQIIVSNPAHARVSLYRAGRSLADTISVPEFDGNAIWLRPGNYFLKCEEGRRTAYLPVPLTGYRCGPDDDGSFLATIRPVPDDFPPRLFNDLPEFQFIPAGSFLFGDRQNPRERHFVWITGYFMAPFEVTNGEFREFLSASDGYNDPSVWTGEGRLWMSGVRSRATALLGEADPDFDRFGRNDLPVSRVTWFEANAFCRWMTKRHADRRWQFSLPTDAEWEKAARGPDNLDYALSMAVSDAEMNLYNWRKNPYSPIPLFGISSTPGLYLPNRFRLYHMTGNLAEWTQSIDRPFNREHPWVDDDRNHDGTAGLRTVRGGSWYSAATSYLYTPYRDSFQPEHCTQDIGFRIVARRLP